MMLKGQRVTHITASGKEGKYGTGTIVEFEESKGAGYVVVQFDNMDETKKFTYPECFGKFLKMEAPEVAKQMDNYNVLINQI